MLASRKSLLLTLAFSVLLCAAAFHSSFAIGHPDDSRNDSKSDSAQGRHTFNSTCAGCHGLDGRGSEKGANIVGSVKARHLSDGQVSNIISNGIPGTGMPAFHNLSAIQIRALVSYLRILQGKLEARTLPGNPVRGKEIFFGKAGCSTCHTISGEGGFLGPELSSYGSALSAKAIRDEIVRPDRTELAGYWSAVLTTGNGDRLDGVIRNEDNFSVQFQTKDGTFHFFQKSDLRAVDHLGRSAMPTNYQERLSSAELNDLVSYLMSGGPAPGKARTSQETGDPTE